MALAPDWSLGGSINLLDELRFANHVDDTQWGHTLSEKGLTEMVTTNAARVLGLETVLGSIEVGKKADLPAIDGDRCAPHEALLAAKVDDRQRRCCTRLHVARATRHQFVVPALAGVRSVWRGAGAQRAAFCRAVRRRGRSAER